MTTPVAHQSVTFDVHDAVVFPMLTDATGGATYGTGKDVPGIQQVSMDPEFATAILKGDAKTLARKGKIDGFTGNFQYGVLDIDVLAAVLGGTVTDSGTSGSETATWRLLGANSLPYFGIGFAIKDVSIGIAQVNVVLYKAQVTGGSIFGQQTDQFGNRNFGVSGIPRLSDDRLIDATIYKTATTLAMPTT